MIAWILVATACIAALMVVGVYAKLKTRDYILVTGHDLLLQTQETRRFKPHRQVTWKFTDTKKGALPLDGNYATHDKGRLHYNVDLATGRCFRIKPIPKQPGPSIGIPDFTPVGLWEANNDGRCETLSATNQDGMWKYSRYGFYAIVVLGGVGVVWALVTALS